MEIMAALIELIPALGFPIVCVIAMGAFIYTIYKNTTKENAANMEKVQARCKEREDKLNEIIQENQKINAEAIATITLYAEKLNDIQDDVKEIKTDIVVITEKLNNK